MRGRVARGGMTIDETPRDPGAGSETPGMARSRTTARDLERYAGLFARRTQGMKSSAMRDLMAITARPEIISLAGGLPDTSTFPAEDVAAIMARVAANASARALQYGPTEGMDELKACIVQVMAAEGMDVGEDELRDDVALRGPVLVPQRTAGQPGEQGSELRRDLQPLGDLGEVLAVVVHGDLAARAGASAVPCARPARSRVR